MFQHNNIFVYICQHLFQYVGYLRHQQQVDLLTLKPVSRVTCDVGYLCANFSLHRPLCSWVRPDVRDRQTDVRQKHHLMPSPHGSGLCRHNRNTCVMQTGDQRVQRNNFLLTAHLQACHKEVHGDSLDKEKVH